MLIMLMLKTTGELIQQYFLTFGLLQLSRELLVKGSSCQTFIDIIGTFCYLLFHLILLFLVCVSSAIFHAISQTLICCVLIVAIEGSD